MNRQRILAVVIGGLALGVTAHPALSELITFEFAGEITHLQDDNGLLPEDVCIGSPFSGLYTFESTTPDSRPTVPAGGFYEDAITNISGEVAGLPFTGPVGSINSILVLNDCGVIGFDDYSAGAGVDFLGGTLQFSLGFRDSSGTVLLDDSLPLCPPPMGAVDRVGFLLSASSEDFRLNGDVTSFTPEPATLMLLALGSLVIGRRRRAT